MPRIDLVEGAAATTDMHDAVIAPLVAFNLATHGPSGAMEMGLLIRGKDDLVIGGLWGVCAYDWLVIKQVVVPDGMRRTGIGRTLVQRAEAFARTRNLIGMWLDTFSFQARGFYEKQGFTCFGSLPDHPRGGARHFMQKTL